VFERFTPNARQVPTTALQELVQLGHEKITTEHLLYGVAADRDGLGGRVLAGLGVDAQRVEALLVERYGRTAPRTTSFSQFTPRAKQALERAVTEADGLGHAVVGTEHVLLALASDPESGSATALASFGAGDVRAAVVRAMSGDE
jgi:ATP-dependent Clp protease ATP-binding subunit ClpC